MGYLLDLPPARPAASGPDEALVGRQAAWDELDDALRRSRLVCIVGTGGVGKTTLARAWQQVHGGAFCDLSEAATLRAALEAVARGAGVPRAEGEDRLVDALALARQLGDPAEIAQIGANLGWLRHMSGDLAGAWAHFTESLDLDRRLGRRLAIARGLANLAFVDHERGDLEAARAGLEACRRMLDGERSPLLRGMADGRMAALEAERGRVQRARSLLESARRLLADAPEPLAGTELLAALLDAAEDAPAAARARVDDAREASRGSGYIGLLLRVVEARLAAMGAR